MALIPESEVRHRAVPLNLSMSRAHSWVLESLMSHLKGINDSKSRKWDSNDYQPSLVQHLQCLNMHWLLLHILLDPPWMLSFCGGAPYGWPLFHTSMFTRRSSHMSQWTYTALTLNNAYYPYAKQVAYHAIHILFQFHVSSYIHHRTVLYMHSVVKWYIPHVNQNLVLKYTSM